MSPSWVVDPVADPYNLKVPETRFDDVHLGFEIEHKAGPGDFATLILVSMLAKSLKQARLRQVRMQQIEGDFTIQICVIILCFITYVYIRRMFRKPLQHLSYIEQYAVPIAMICYSVCLLGIQFFLN
jgi:hypothetical protein